MDKLYEILATLHYNCERGEPLESVLAKFLVMRNPEFNIEAEVRKTFFQKMKRSEEKQRTQDGLYINSEVCI